MHVQLPSATRDEVFRLETRRLWLRWPKRADAEALHQVAAPANVAGMTATWPHPLPNDEVARRIEGIRANNATGGSLALALTPKSDPDRLIGVLGCDGLATESSGIGYFLLTDLHGNGLMTEAVSGLLDFLFIYAQLPTVVASSRVVNPASARVLVKCGFVPEGRRTMATAARGPESFEVDQWRLTRSQWLTAAPVTCLRRPLVCRTA